MVCCRTHRLLWTVLTICGLQLLSTKRADSELIPVVADIAIQEGVVSEESRFG